MSLKLIEEQDTPEGVLKEMLARVNSFEGVICIALNKDSSQFLMTSRISGSEKALLVAFAQSWMMSWFHNQEEQTE